MSFINILCDCCRCIQGDFTAEVGSKLMLRVDPSLHHFKYVALVGVEPTKPGSSTASPMDLFSMGVDSGVPRPLVTLGRTIASLAHSANAGSVGLALPKNSGDALNAPGSVTELIVGLHEGAYADFRFRKLPKSTSRSSSVDASRGNWKAPDSLTLIQSHSARSVESDGLDVEAAHGHAIASGVALARDLVGMSLHYISSKRLLSINTCIYIYLHLHAHRCA
jgi:leucyl aminopeptidase